MLGVQNYEAAFGTYPPGTIDRRGPLMNIPSGYHHSWITQILPYLEKHNADRQLDRSLSVYHVNNRPVRQHDLKILHCPSRATIGRGYSDYAGVHNHFEGPIHTDNTGVFFLNSRVR